MKNKEIPSDVLSHALIDLVVQYVLGFVWIPTRIVYDRGSPKDGTRLWNPMFAKHDNWTLENPLRVHYTELPILKDLADLESLLPVLEKTFPRGFRWRPDNGLLLCYRESYDTATVQIDADTLWRGVCFALLVEKGFKIIHV
jgi:hypothetical protein